MKTKILFTTICWTFCFYILTGQTIIKIENLDLGGPYAGTIDAPFNGVAFYGNCDMAQGSVTLSTLPGLYNIEIRGASSNESEAKINFTIGEDVVTSFGFNGVSPTVTSKEVAISGTNPLSVKLELLTDNGSNDTFVDYISFTYLGPPPPDRPAPVIPSVSSFESGSYRNMFVESGKTEAVVAQKLNAIWDQYFVNGDSNNERLYYQVGRRFQRTGQVSQREIYL